MRMSESIGALAEALAQAQAAFEVPKKSHTATVQTKVGGSYAYHYSTLDEMIAATRTALTQHKLSAVQNVTTPDGGNVAVATTLLHASGEFVEFDPVVLPSGGSPQTVGAAITYARRYSLGAALNVAAEEDDDAQSVKPSPLKTAEAPASMLASSHADGCEVANYLLRDGWHEADLLGYFEDGAGLHVSTKLGHIGRQLADAAKQHVAVKADVTFRKGESRKAYVNSLELLAPADAPF